MSAPNDAKGARQLAQPAVSDLSSCFDAAADVLSEKLLGRAVPVFQDDLPSVSVSRLRASGVVTAAMTRTLVAGVEVDLDLVQFANGGSWSFFLCPYCSRRARTLKLFEGCVLCWRCCHRRGARYRVRMMTPRRCAEQRIPRLRAMLESPTSLRLKPVLWGQMERRARHEAALARCEFIVSKSNRRFRDVQAEEIPPEPIVRPKVKTTR